MNLAQLEMNWDSKSSCVEKSKQNTYCSFNSRLDCFNFLLFLKYNKLGNIYCQYHLLTYTPNC